MNVKSEAFNHEELQWVNDLVLFRSLMGHVPWALRFGEGDVKALRFDETTGAGAWLFSWPAGYDPFGEHAGDANEHRFVLSGDLRSGDRVYGAGSFFFHPAGVPHGPYAAGPDGCVFLAVLDGPLFSKEFLDSLVAEGGRASRLRGSKRKKS